MKKLILPNLFYLFAKVKTLFFVLILLLITTATNAQTFEWGKGMIGVDTISRADTRDIMTTINGDLLVVGSFFGTVDFDPSSAVDTISSTTLYGEMFVAKYDAAGSFLWVKNFPSTMNSTGLEIELDDNKNIYITGYFTGVTDLDPGPGTVNVNLVSNPGYQNTFIVKLDQNGNYKWSHMYEVNTNAPTAKLIYSNGYLYMTGWFASYIDFDYSANVDAITPNNFSGFLHKIDTSSNHQWVRHLEDNKIKDMDCDNNGNVLLTITISDTTIITMGSGTDTLNLPIFNYSWYNSVGSILKVDATGNLLWAKCFEKGHSIISHIKSDNNNNIYVLGGWRDTIDWDMGSGQHLNSGYLGSQNFNDWFMIKNDPNGNMIWVNELIDYNSFVDIEIDNAGNSYITTNYVTPIDADPGYGYFPLSGYPGNTFLIQQFGSNGDLGWFFDYPILFGGEMDIDNNDNLFLVGFGNSQIDYDITAGTYYINNIIQSDNVIVKLGSDTCNAMNAVIDSVLSPDCNAAGFVSSVTRGGVPPYTYSWNTGSVDTFITVNSSAIYEITVSDQNNCARTTSTLVNGPTTQVGYDLQINMIANGFVSGFSSSIFLDAFNEGCVPVSGLFGIVLDDSVSFNFSTIPPDYINGDTLVWDFTNLIYGTHIQPQISITTDSTAVLGSQLCFATFITPDISDLDITNNYRNYCYTVVGSYDPNDKSIYPKGPCSVNYIQNTEILTYTVRFQNTGTSPAQNVYIIDELDTNLNISTVNIVGQAHANLIVEVLPNNKLKFRFDNIMLIDSLTDEPNSHGYVVFEVETYPNTPYGTQIDNTVGIYFDYNPPVITNTVSTVIVDSITPLPPAYIINRFSDSLVIRLENNYTYQWYNGGGVIVINETAFWIIPDWVGTYNVQITDSNGCSVISGDYNFTFVGLSPELNNKAKVYPNPFTEYTYLEFDEVQENTKVELLDIQGKVLKTYTVNGRKLKIEREGLPVGIYMIQLVDGSRKIIAE